MPEEEEEILSCVPSVSNTGIFAVWAFESTFMSVDPAYLDLFFNARNSAVRMYCSSLVVVTFMY